MKGFASQKSPVRYIGLGTSSIGRLYRPQDVACPFRVVADQLGIRPISDHRRDATRYFTRAQKPNQKYTSTCIICRRKPAQRTASRTSCCRQVDKLTVDQGCSGAGTRGDGVPHFYRQGDASSTTPHFFGLKFVQKLVHCCNWLLTETQCKIVSVQQN